MSLPAPCNGGEVYLAAILDELRALNAKLAPEAGNPPAQGDEVALKEPAPLQQTKKRK